MKYIGRFAPSPTGPLHLGSLATAVGSYLDAKLHQGKWLVRIEDIDEERCSTKWSEEIITTLGAHGLTSDEAPIIQTHRYAAYQSALDRLTQGGLTYPCACTRREIELANEGRPTGQNRLYPGTCANGIPEGRRARAMRFRCPRQSIHWNDIKMGLTVENLIETSGDFVLKRGDGFWAYHLAVAIDDIASQVTHVVRGQDLADTTARQVALYEAFNEKPPEYWHLPVILATDGQKLSKQTGAQALPNNQPLCNLNRIWEHFGLPKVQANDPAQWLSQAIPVWSKYRSQSTKS